MNLGKIAIGCHPACPEFRGERSEGSAFFCGAELKADSSPRSKSERVSE